MSARGLDWFTAEYNFEITLSKNIKDKDFHKTILKKAKAGYLNVIYQPGTKKHLTSRIKRLNLDKNEDHAKIYSYKNLTITYFYKKGRAHIYYKGYPAIMRMFVESHESKNNRAWFYLALVYSVVLAFLAISAMFMLKGKNSFRRRGIYLAISGVMTIVLFLYLSFYI